MNTIERDELADIIASNRNEYADKTADRILTAGYLKHRTITTAVELAALPRFTVIRSAEGSVFERQTMWHEAGSRDLKYWTDIALPVTVLQIGWGEE